MAPIYTPDMPSEREITVSHFGDSEEVGTKQVYSYSIVMSEVWSEAWGEIQQSPYFGLKGNSSPNFV